MAAWEKLVVVFLVAFTYLNHFIECRYGHPSQTLHLQSENNGEQLNLHYLPLNSEKKTLDKLSHEIIPHRLRRSIKPENEQPNFNVSVYTLKDSHYQLVVHWAGQGSDVVVFLAKDNNKLRQNGSDVFFSYDYGKHFKNCSALLTLHDGTAANIHTFFNSPVYNSYYVFTDLVDHYIFTTRDYGKSFSKTHLPFIPDVVSLHITNEKVILAMDGNDTEKKLWLSEDFGETWTVMQLHVKSFFWGVKQVDNENVLYIERLEPNGKSSVLRFPDFSTNRQNVEVLITDVEDFQLKDKYMFATRRQRLLGSKSKNGTLQLWVSYNRGPFQKAVFPNTKIHNDYYIPDASEGQVFVCVNHANMETNLYISDVRGVEYSLSLERVFYFSPKTAGIDTWLSIVTEETFADFYKIEGLTGVYIASQLSKDFKNDNDLGPEDLMTVITFDKGGHWMPLNPPQRDQHGRPIDCKLSSNCSLHLSQRFNQLYPPLRTTLIRSQKSAVGLILASGVLGKSLKGHPGIFLSTDAGYSWHKILDGNYFYAIGDHGGIIAAVKAYWGEGSTNELYYSVDEGETWSTFKFANESIRVYGLMTEPGEKTTIFTLFGSLPNTHQWLIITMDLKAAFKRGCTTDDYKNWSPSDGLTSEYRHCLLGQEENYQRRISKRQCYNGQDYERVVLLEKCECRLEDYECDIGYIWDERTKRVCVHDNSSNIYPYAIPELCREGDYFNRSRGYRKIPGDVCDDAMENQYKPQEIACPVARLPEFILFSQRKMISRISLATDTKVETLPIPKLQNVIAVEYNFVNNCVYWADIEDDNILSLCLDGKGTPEVLVETGLSSIEGLAFDWLTHNLYFVDGELGKIQVIRTDIRHMGRLRRTILERPKLDKPRGIALDPHKGYLFWTDWGTNPSISRSYLDGTNVNQLISKSIVFWPNGITIDYPMERIYWVDAKLDYIASADFNGKNMKYLIQSSNIAPHPFAIAVYKDWIYWDDWIRHSILVADKFDGSGIQVVASNLVGIMDLKVYDRARQMGENPCKNTNCTHLCMARPNGVSCICPDGFEEQVAPDGNEMCLCRSDEEMDANGRCAKKGNICPNETFACSNSFCIPPIWQCDGDNDCGDNSDEVNCAANSCNPNQFACKNGICIPSTWKCDMESDCLDGSDEMGCKYPECDKSQFKCKNGGCINLSWVCDLDDDCRDGSDEANCSSLIKTSCDTGEFQCKTGNQCIHQAWRCDGDRDCHDNSDEEDCSNHTCQSWQFNCSNGKCIFKTWRCDGHDDCKDNSDENGCEHTTTTTTTSSIIIEPTASSANCTPWLFKCQSSGKCIPVWWKCDHVSDCSDGSDEFDCAYTATTQTSYRPTTPTPTSVLCGENHFMCDNGNCIWQAWVCDGEKDCDSGEDEAHCISTCGPNYFHCLHSTGCIPRQYVCNGVFDCADRTDENGCSSTLGPFTNISICGPESFECESGDCIAAVKRCDDFQDCLDGSDEENCRGVEREFAVESLTIDLKSVRKNKFKIIWSLIKLNYSTFEYLPTIREVATNTSWHNSSKWIKTNEYTFEHLKPFTTYEASVYVRTNSSHISNPVRTVTQKTLPDVSTPPRNLSLKQEHSKKYVLTWDQPLHPNSHLLEYRLYISPPIPPRREDLNYFSERKKILENYFEPENNYSIWMTAVGYGTESNKSNVVHLHINSNSVLQAVTNLAVKAYDNLSVVLTWSGVKQKIDGYLVSITSQNEFTRYETREINDTTLNVTGLSPGATYTFLVQPFKGDNHGPPVDIVQRTKDDPLQPPRDLNVDVSGVRVHLAWELPQDKRKMKWEYGISYGLNKQDLIQQGIRGRTSDLSFNVTNLTACETYAFLVRVIGPLGLGPPTNPKWKTTDFDHRSPPKALKFTIIDLTAIISWRASCNHIKFDVGYKIFFDDLKKNRTSQFDLVPSPNVKRTHNFTIKYGGKYAVRIQTLHKEARPTDPLMFDGPPLPTPNHIRLMKNEDVFELDWEVENVPQTISSHKFSYIVMVSQNESDFTHAEIYETANSKLPLDTLVEGHVYYLAVRLKDENGYLSEPSNTISFVKPLESMVVLTTTSLVGILVAVVVLLVALLSALGFLYMRHKRLQRVTLTFANSHYNTRSGAATFTTGDELGDFIDEEDSPMIRGFSDDEPLVIA